jgi:hypothetical protein
MVAQGLGFLRRYIEYDVEQQKPGAEQALEWMIVVEAGAVEGSKEIQRLQNKLTQAKIAIG